MLKTILIILTLSEAGTTHLALTEATSMDDCRDKADVVSQILTGAGAQIVGVRCGAADISFTAYDHGYSEADMHWHYHVTLNGTAIEDGFTLKPVQAGSCQANSAAAQYCTVSAQGPASD